MRYLTVVLRLADNAENKLVFEQIDRINGATLSAASWSHEIDHANNYREALEKIIDRAAEHATDESPMGWHWINIVKIAKTALGLPLSR